MQANVEVQSLISPQILTNPIFDVRKGAESQQETFENFEEQKCKVISALAPENTKTKVPGLVKQVCNNGYGEQRLGTNTA